MHCHHEKIAIIEDCATREFVQPDRHRKCFRAAPAHAFKSSPSNLKVVLRMRGIVPLIYVIIGAVLPNSIITSRT
jgi:hypothetical protein